MLARFQNSIKFAYIFSAIKDDSIELVEDSVARDSANPDRRFSSNSPFSYFVIKLSTVKVVERIEEISESDVNS